MKSSSYTYRPWQNIIFFGDHSFTFSGNCYTNYLLLFLLGFVNSDKIALVNPEDLTAATIQLPTDIIRHGFTITTALPINAETPKSLKGCEPPYSLISGFANSNTALAGCRCHHINKACIALFQAFIKPLSDLCSPIVELEYPPFESNSYPRFICRTIALRVIANRSSGLNSVVEGMGKIFRQVIFRSQLVMHARHFSFALLFA